MSNKIQASLPPFEVKYRLMTLAETKDYGHTLHNIPAAWKTSKGEGVKIAVLDTGLPVHRDLENQIEDAANFTQDPIEDHIQGHSTHCCLTYDNEVVVKEEDEIKFLKIGDLVEKTYNKYKDLKILSFNHDTKKTEFKKIIATSRKKLDKDLYEIEAKSSKTILTEDHPVLWAKNRKVKNLNYKEARGIKSKERVISPYGLDFSYDKKIYTLDFVDDLKNLSLSLDGRSRDIVIAFIDSCDAKERKYYLERMRVGRLNLKKFKQTCEFMGVDFYEEVDYGNLYPSRSRIKNRKIKLPKIINSEEASFLWYLAGMVLGDGTKRNKRKYNEILFSEENDYSHLHEFLDMFECSFGIRLNYYIRDKGEPEYSASFNRVLKRNKNLAFVTVYNPFCSIIKNFFNLRKKEKSNIYRLMFGSPSNIKSFVSGLFDSDGTYSLHSRRGDFSGSVNYNIRLKDKISLKYVGLALNSMGIKNSFIDNSRFSSGVVHYLGISRGRDLKQLFSSSGINPSHNKWKSKEKDTIDFLENCKQTNTDKVVVENCSIVRNHNYEWVYNVEVEDNNNFIANGIVVHNCGIIAAEENGEGVVGVAPKSRLYVGKVLGDNGSGGDEEIANGILWAVEKKVDIISMSLGAPASMEAFMPKTKAAVKEAYAQNIAIICASGNENSRLVGVPARFDECIAVGAVNDRKQRARFSNRGTALDFAAAGVDVLSTYKNNTYAELSGTSMSCPQIVGIAALVVSDHRNREIPSSTPIEGPEGLKEHIRKISVDLGPAGHDSDYGHGMPVFSTIEDPLPPPPLNKPKPIPGFGFWKWLRSIIPFWD